MARQTRKASRKGPTSSATAHPEGTIEWGNDGQRWVVKKAANGVPRWVPVHTAVLFGWRPLTAKVLAENIGKTITVYERQLSDTWPRTPKAFDVTYKFKPSGDGELIKKGKRTMYPNWLKKRTFKIGRNDIFSVLGVVNSKDISMDSVQVAPTPGELASSNLMNTEAFF
jgi:hypothetical protein